MCLSTNPASSRVRSSGEESLRKTSSIRDSWLRFLVSNPEASSKPAFGLAATVRCTGRSSSVPSAGGVRLSLDIKRFGSPTPLGRIIASSSSAAFAPDSVGGAIESFAGFATGGAVCADTETLSPSVNKSTNKPIFMCRTIMVGYFSF